MTAPLVRTALVTGANRGIGLAIGQALSSLDHVRVITGARRPADATSAAADMAPGTVGVHLDLSDLGQVEARARAIEARHGPVDILVNNAAVLTPGSGLDTPVPELVQSLNVNTIAPFALIRALVPGMVARGWGRVVNLSSGWGSFHEGLTGPLAYGVSKAALNALTLTLARELSPAVKINAACPGWVRTRMGGSGATLSAEEGADTPVWLATLPDDGPTGRLFRDRRPVPW